MVKFILGCFLLASTSAMAVPVNYWDLSTAQVHVHSLSAGKLISISTPRPGGGSSGTDDIVEVNINHETFMNVVALSFLDVTNALCDWSKQWALDAKSTMFCIAN